MRRNAFTLVELLIVVIILGILAAVVIPQFSDASTDARVSSLTTNLATIRGQIEFYKLQHNGNYPNLTVPVPFADAMTKKTDVGGGLNAVGKYGPYLQAIPMNPFTNTNTITGTAGSGAAWYYDEATGAFLADDGGSEGGTAHNLY
ncbi:MAG: type II secretion system protein [Phycisphaerae bacterium]